MIRDHLLMIAVQQLVIHSAIQNLRMFSVILSLLVMSQHEADTSSGSICQADQM